MRRLTKRRLRCDHAINLPPQPPGLNPQASETSRPPDGGMRCSQKRGLRCAGFEAEGWLDFSQARYQVRLQILLSGEMVARRFNEASGKA